MQEFLLEPNEDQLVDIALAMPLDKKIHKAVELLRLWEPMALKMSPDGYWLAYSGGKDSDCILELAKMAGVKYRPVYNVTTIDPPELVRYIKREHPEVEFSRQEKTLLTEMVENKSCLAPPTRLARWCCERYKEVGGNGMAKVLGVRVAESPRRKTLWKTVINNRKSGKIICPIVYWTDDDVWEFHKQRDLKYCHLYEEGFNRLGCVGCPMAGTEGQLKAFARWPKYELLWKRAFKRFWEKWHGVPKRDGSPRYFEDFGDWETFWEWWISGTSKTEDEQCQGMSLFD